MTLIDKAEALAPCPFCGEQGELDGTTWRPTDGKEVGWITCKGCNAYGPTLPKKDAIAAWNRRALPAAVPVVKPFGWIGGNAACHHALVNELAEGLQSCTSCGAVRGTALAPSPARDVREAAWDAAVYNMDRSQQFKDGAAWGIRKSIAWLHHRATEMNDPHAEAILNTAATNLGMWKGWHVRHRKHRSLIGEPRA